MLIIDQCFARSGPGLLDLSYKDRVIAAVKSIHDTAFEICERAFNDRNSCDPGPIFHDTEFVVNWRRKMLGKVALRFAENIDYKGARFAKGVMAGGNFFDADKHQRRR